MPSNWLSVDTNFPAFTGEESVTEKVTTIQSYMFMLVEQLRYTLHNLDLSNMNKTAVNKFTETITEPIYGRIADAEDSITQLAVTAQGLGVRVSNAEGNITSLTLTASGLQTQVSNQSGQISSLSQTVNGFTLSASNGANYAYLYLSSGGINFGSAYISFTGMVTFSDLSTGGRTTINGANITSGTITGATLRSIASNSQVWIQNGGMNIYNGSGTLAGGLYYDNNGAGTTSEAKSRVFLHSSNGNALKIMSAGNMSIEAGGKVYAMGTWDFTYATVIGLGG